MKSTPLIAILYIVFTAVLSPVNSNVEEDCGIQYYGFNRIAQGYDAQPKEYPWMVSIRRENEVHTCGGVLINPRWVLTAAHCLVKYTSFHDPKKWTVTLGRIKLDEKRDEEITTRTTNILIHTDYNHKLMVNDIALIRLQDSIPISSYIRTICIAEQNTGDFANSHCYFAGWGSESNVFVEVMNHLQVLPVKVLTNKECLDNYISLPRNRKITDDMMCAADSRNRLSKGGACAGDSGGPLMCKKNGHWYVGGIASWSGGCDFSNNPIVFVRVNSYYDWIDNKIRNA